MSALTSRLKRLEERSRYNPHAKRDAWRAYLRQEFAAAEYDGHREQIVEALSGDKPGQYSFERQDGPDRWLYIVDWYGRDQGEAPDVITVVLRDYADWIFPPFTPDPRRRPAYG